MDEFPEDERRIMAGTIEESMRSGFSANGVKLSKEAFQLMYQLAMGVNTKVACDSLV